MPSSGEELNTHFEGNKSSNASAKPCGMMCVMMIIKERQGGVFCGDSTISLGSPNISLKSHALSTSDFFKALGSESSVPSDSSSSTVSSWRSNIMHQGEDRKCKQERKNPIKTCWQTFDTYGMTATKNQAQGYVDGQRKR